jgi:hypothetical protein
MLVLPVRLMAPVKGLLKKSERKSHLHTIGNREIETHGLDTGGETSIIDR